MEVNQYLSMFIDESREHLQAMNDNLLRLEQQPDEVSIVQQIFRSAHTLKGMSATMGFEDIASLTHEMENVLDLVRNRQLKMNADIFDCLFKGTDSLESMVEDIIQGGAGKADVSAIVAGLKSIVAGDFVKAGSGPAVAAQSADGFDIDQYQYSVLQQSVESGHRAFHIEVSLSEECLLKAVRAYMVFDLLERNGEVVKSTPPVQDIEQEKFERSFSVYYITGQDQKTLERMIANISEVERVKAVELTTEGLEQAYRQNVNAVQAMNETAAAAAPAKPDAAAGKPAQTAAPVASRTIRVDIDRLDTLMNLFSELLIDRVRLEQLASEVRRNDLTETVEHMSRVSGDLQSIVLKLRMVPIDTVFNRFPRMIRDIAKSLDKKVDLVIAGAETELDRTVIDEIGDPLVHLLRNAVDHGLETVSERIAAGKNETGKVYLRAFNSGNHVFIEVEEDGRGINRDKVLKTAIKNGVVTQEQAGRLSDEEVQMLIFAAGFSTADKISDISGRGVGLDVVKTKIESLGGRVGIESKPGQGTKFSVQLPLTLSIIAAMLIRVGEEKFAIPLSSIVETAASRPEEIRNVHGQPMLDYRKSVVPILALGDVLEVPAQAEKSGENALVIVRKGDKLVALLVNELIGQREIVLKPLGKYLPNVFAVSGATILGDGQVALIVDTNQLIK